MGVGKRTLQKRHLNSSFETHTVIPFLDYTLWKMKFTTLNCQNTNALMFQGISRTQDDCGLLTSKPYPILSSLSIGRGSPVDNGQGNTKLAFYFRQGVCVSPSLVRYPVLHWGTSWVLASKVPDLSNGKTEEASAPGLTIEENPATCHVPGGYSCLLYTSPSPRD